MSAAYLEADLGALHRLAELLELFGRGELATLSEVRQLEDRFGLTPKARQLLQWQVLGAGEKPAGGAPASSSPATGPQPAGGSNVRRLRAVDPKAATS